MRGELDIDGRPLFHPPPIVGLPILGRCLPPGVPRGPGGPRIMGDPRGPGPP